MQVTKENPDTGELRTKEINVTEEQLRAIKRGARPTSVAPQLKAWEILFIEQGRLLDEAVALDRAIQRDGLGFTPPNPTDEDKEGELGDPGNPL